MPSGTGLDKFQERYPARFFDVGIAEEHAVTFAGGLAAGGLKPVVAIYSTFLQRAYDSIIHDIAMPAYPVVFAIDRSGIVGDDGETHQGVFDISFLSHVPNFVIMSPADEAEFKEMLELAFKLKRPVALRYPRGEVTASRIGGGKVIYNRSAVVRNGKHTCILSVGTMLVEAIKAADELKKEGIETGIVNARFIKPLDTVMLKTLARKYKKIVIVEENLSAGGFGSLVLDYYDKNSIKIELVRLGLPDKFIEHGSRKILLEKYGISKESIIKAVRQ